MNVNFAYKGGFSNMERFLVKCLRIKPVVASILRKYGQRGVEALAAATPKDSGLTSESWSYEIEEEDGSASIVWKNDNINDGQVIAILLQYGHGTGTGGYVEGIDYINPAIRGIFKEIADEAWKEVTS